MGPSPRLGPSLHAQTTRLCTMSRCSSCSGGGGPSFTTCATDPTRTRHSRRTTSPATQARFGSSMPTTRSSVRDNNHRKHGPASAVTRPRRRLGLPRRKRRKRRKREETRPFFCLQYSYARRANVELKAPGFIPNNGIMVRRPVPCSSCEVEKVYFNIVFV